MGLELPWIWEPTGLQNQLVPRWFFVGSLLVFLLVFLWFPVGFLLNSRWFPLVPVGSRWFPLVPVGSRWF
jgi:hypothetical protein